MKFIIEHFQHKDEVLVHYMDGRFYTYHDEWYWYQLLNGVRALGDEPLQKNSGCESPVTCSAWVSEQSPRPLGLSYVDDRLYSNRFYGLALSNKRKLGLGALLIIPATKHKPQRIGFRLEYMDAPTADEVLVYFSALKQTLFATLSKDLKWITRSPFQETLAEKMISKGWLQPSQVMGYSELAEEGEAEIYNAGITVGRLIFVETMSDAMAYTDNSQILVMASPPDELPSAAGLIAAVPMTPLSHVNLLAKNRGIPSVYVGGVMQNAYMKQLADGHAPVVLDARAEEIRVRPLSEDEYKRFSTNTLEIKFNNSIDYPSAPYTLTLAEASAYSKTDKSELIGGKAAGFEVLYAAVPKQIPSDVLFITTRAYTEHLASLQPEINTLLQHPAFLNSAKVRYYTLEGKVAFQKLFHTREDAELLLQLKRMSPLHFHVGEKGGIKGRIRAALIPECVMHAVETALHETFSGYPQSQGLRFRSSSTVEDIDGFSGAGLYVSSTGYLFADAVEDTDEKAQTIAWALKKTWASFWNFQAFEERQNAGMDHLSGAMGVVVHPRFDDAFEQANGVATFTMRQNVESSSRDLWAQMDINVQMGAVSVTNPPLNVDASPETVKVQLRADQQLTIERTKKAGLNGQAIVVLSDAEITQLFFLCRDIFLEWQLRKNHENPVYSKSLETTLDLEFRKMAADWPGFGASGVDGESRLVLKQVRALESTPQIRGILSLNLNAPRDILLKAIRVQRRICADSEHQITLLESTLVQNDAKSVQTRYISDVALTVGGRVEVLTSEDFVQPNQNNALEFVPAAAKRLGISRLSMERMACDTTVLASTDRDILEQFSRQGKVIGRVK